MYDEKSVIELIELQPYGSFPLSSFRTLTELELSLSVLEMSEEDETSLNNDVA